MRKVTYCHGWSMHYNEPLEIYTEKKARQLHDKGKQYAALLGDDPYRPEVAITFNKGAIIIEYLDENLRMTSRAMYADRKDGMIFLESITGKGGPIEGTKNDYETMIIYYNKDGTGHKHHWTADGMFEKCDTIWPHIERNWHAVPDFGDYESIVAAPMLA